jgi:uncharacterized protein YdgA (DUF945 family)
MNKSKIAVGVIVALGVVWTGAAWFTGKQLENHRDELVQQANAQLNQIAPLSRLKVSYQDYQRGVFSSQAQVVIQASSQTEDNAFLRPGQSIVLNENIDHGPFPFAQLKKFNLIPSMASVHSQLENTEALKRLFELTQGKSLVQAETRIGYSGATDTAVNMLPVDYQNAQSGERLATNGGQFNISADSKGDKVSFDSSIGSLAVTSKNQMDQPVLFTLNGMEMSGNTHLTAQGVRIGDQNLKLDKLTASVNGQDAFALQGVKLKSAFDAKDNLIAGDTDLAADKITLLNQDFGQAKLTLKLSQLDGDAFKAFQTSYNAQMEQLMNQPGIAQDPLRYQLGVRQVLANNLPLLLKGSPVVNIAPLSWKNSKGESTLNFAVNFKDPATVTGEPQTLGDAVDRVLKTVDGKLVINMDMATEVMRRVGMSQGYNEADANKLAEQQVKGFAAMGQMFRLTTQQDDNIVTSLQYATGQVTMNGEKMPLDQFLAHYMLGIPAGMPQ